MAYFDPKTNKYPYPLETDHHYLVVKKNDGTVFDESYPYVDRSKGYRRKRFWVRFLFRTIIFPMSHIRLGLKIKGRDILKKYKDILDEGAISVANHVHMWDYICVTNAIRPRKPRILVWAPNISGEMGGMIRSVGGIPIPENDLRATGAYLRSIYDYLESGGWLHIYPEGSMWEYYAPIRPFKVGAASIAVHTDKPIVPMGFSYRKPGWFRRVILRQIATYTLTIGEPIYADSTLSVHEQELDLTKRMHDAVCALAGIDPKENIYPPTFEDSKRIDYYTDQYGIGYKGSW